MRAVFADEPRLFCGVVRPTGLWLFTTFFARREDVSDALRFLLRGLPPTGERRFANGRAEAGCAPEPRLSFFERRSDFPSAALRASFVWR